MAQARLALASLYEIKRLFMSARFIEESLTSKGSKIIPDNSQIHLPVTAKDEEGLISTGSLGFNWARFKDDFNWISIFQPHEQV